MFLVCSRLGPRRKIWTGLGPSRSTRRRSPASWRRSSPWRDLAATGTPARLRRPTYRAVLRVLRPAEAAVRRLIVIAAKGLKAKLPPMRPFPQGLALAGRRGERVSFQLFDARERFGRAPRKCVSTTAAPRVFIYGSGPLVPLFQRRPVAI